jgi:hypothetical protein
VNKVYKLDKITVEEIGRITTLNRGFRYGHSVPLMGYVVYGPTAQRMILWDM